MEKLTLVKIGGNIIDKAEKLDTFLSKFAQISGHKVLVHGGGKLATSLSKKLGVPPKMTQGRRITDQSSLEIVTMVYAGLINKSIVAKLQSFQCNALGLTGADANSINAIKRPVRDIDFGFVGDIHSNSINGKALNSFICASFVPVFAAITHDGKGQLLNTNADTLASALSIALSKNYEVSLVYCFEKKGVLQSPEDDHSVIPVLNIQEFNNLLDDNIVSDGMIPKLQNAFQALEKGVHKIIIGDAEDLPKLEKENFGTTLIK